MSRHQASALAPVSHLQANGITSYMLSCFPAHKLSVSCFVPDTTQLNTSNVRKFICTFLA